MIFGLYFVFQVLKETRFNISVVETRRGSLPFLEVGGRGVREGPGKRGLNTLSWRICDLGTTRPSLTFRTFVRSKSDRTM